MTLFRESLPASELTALTIALIAAAFSGTTTLLKMVKVAHTRLPSVGFRS